MKEVIEMLELEIGRLDNFRQLAKQTKESYVVGYFTKKINKITEAIKILNEKDDTNNESKALNMHIVNVSDFDELLTSLNNYAKSYDPYEYGLPIGFVDSDVELNEQREIVKQWFHSR